MPMSREEIEAKRAEAMAQRAAAPAARANGPGVPNQSRLTLARAAVRPEMKGRVMLSGPAGAGKTYTALVIASVLVGPAGRVLVIDTEKESSLTYADVFSFEQLPWNPPFDPTALSLTLKEAAPHYDCIIVDSFSHFWRKQGGVLDIAGDNVRGWKAARPIQENLIETILDIDAHVIVCCRSKMEHLIEDKGGGKITVTKAGIKAQQDDDLEYEVNVALEIDMPHVLHIVKSRTNAVPVGAQFLAGLAGDFAQQYREWLAAGEAVADKADTDALREAIRSIEDEGLRNRAIGGFLDTFGRPEFLLVSRLPEARQWVADLLAGTLPVERAEDETPPEDEPPDTPASAPAPRGDDAAPTTGKGSAAQETSTHSASDDPAERGGVRLVRPEGVEGVLDTSDVTTGDLRELLADDEPHPDGVQHEANVEGPAVFNGDTGYCSACGSPIWFSAQDSTGDGGWLHADDADDLVCPVGDGVSSTLVPAEEGVEVDQLYLASHQPKVDVDAISAEVGALSQTKLLQALGDAGLPLNGRPKDLKARLVAHRCGLVSAGSTVPSTK